MSCVALLQLLFLHFSVLSGALCYPTKLHWIRYTAVISQFLTDGPVLLYISSPMKVFIRNRQKRMLLKKNKMFVSSCLYWLKLLTEFCICYCLMLLSLDLYLNKYVWSSFKVGIHFFVKPVRKYVINLQWMCWSLVMKTHESNWKQTA